LKLALRSLVVVALLCSPARAQLVSDPQPETEPAHVPHFRPAGGPIFGIDGGLGIFAGGCDGCSILGGIGLGLYGGLLLTQRLALLFDARGVIHPLPLDGELKGLLSSSNYSLTAQWWLKPDLWGRAGFGVGLRSRAQGGDQDYRAGPSITLALGSEQKHRPSGGINLSVHVTAATLRDAIDDRLTVFWSAAGFVGAHWN
jgi:hypothetical protein